MNYAQSTSQHNVANSRASSSLDLEWEHEYQRNFLMQSCHDYAAVQALQQRQQPEKRPQQASDCNKNSQIELNDFVSWQYLNRYEEDEQLNSMASNSSFQSAAKKPFNEQRYNKLQNKIRAGSFTRTSSHNSWSHISTPESLEWDVDEEQQQQQQLRMEDDGLDHETLKLLHQIEQLKNRVLYETGDGESAELSAPELNNKDHCLILLESSNIR